MLFFNIKKQSKTLTASQHTWPASPSYIPEKKKPKVNHPYSVVKQVFEAVHFDIAFNEIVEKAAEWK